MGEQWKKLGMPAACLLLAKLFFGGGDLGGVIMLSAWAICITIYDCTREG